MGISSLPKGMLVSTPDIPANTASPTLRQHNYIAEILARLESFEDFEIEMLAMHVHEGQEGTAVEFTFGILGKGGKVCGANEDED